MSMISEPTAVGKIEGSAATEALRHRCRKCRGKLKAPTDNEHRAFCTRFCFDAFYRKRCRVCEEPMLRKNEGQRIKSGHNHCKADLRKWPQKYAFRAGDVPPDGFRKPKSRNAHSTGIKSALASNRARIISPAHVIAVEVFGGHPWQPAISSSGTAIQVSRLRPRVLVDRPAATDGAAP
jgi:hypothetical protein